MGMTPIIEAMGMTARQLSETERSRIQEQFRIPVDSSHPATYWLASLDAQSLMPTEQELEQLQGFIEYKIRSWYNPTYQAKLLGMPLAKDSGHNTIIFRKGSAGAGSLHDDDGWAFRRMTWSEGPMYVPARYPAESYEKMSLVQVMDYCERHTPEEPNEKWEAWKQDHAELFGAEVELAKI
jgi:hypothetical protein